jgi:hypothetical protein
MVDVLRLARSRREELSGELAALDDFVRMAEELLTRARPRKAVPEVDPFQAMFNSGEVLPPLPADDRDWVPVEAGGVHIMRSGPGSD